MVIINGVIDDRNDSTLQHHFSSFTKATDPPDKNDTKGLEGGWAVFVAN